MHTQRYQFKKHGFIVLYICSNEWIVARGYNLFKYNVVTGKRIYFSRLMDGKNNLYASFKLTRRLFRAEITHLYHFQHDNWMCIAKKGIFHYNKETDLFEKCCDIERGARPMNLCQSNDGTIYWGEYFNNHPKDPVRIFHSKDNGLTWSVAYTFQKGEIEHIHGVFNDPYTGRLWVATGDDDESCFFGYTEDGFKTFVKEFAGTQQYRVCVPLFTPDEIIFATDSQYEQNVIRSIDRRTGQVRDLQKIQGSGIYAAQNGRLMMVSTTVEPSTVNTDQSSHLWYSWDGHDWKELISFEKDCLPNTYFQFGSIRFPNYEGESDYLAFNGRALKKLDGKTMIIPIAELER